MFTFLKCIFKIKLLFFFKVLHILDELTNSVETIFVWNGVLAGWHGNLEQGPMPQNVCLFTSTLCY